MSFAEYYADNPTYAGDLGLHEFDSRIDVSQAAIMAEAARLKRWHEEFTAIDPARRLTERLDREFCARSSRG